MLVWATSILNREMFCGHGVVEARAVIPQGSASMYVARYRGIDGRE